MHLLEQMFGAGVSFVRGSVSQWLSGSTQVCRGFAQTAATVRRS